MGEEKSVVPPPDNDPEDDRVSSDPQCFPPRELDFCSPSPNLAGATVIVSRGSGHLFDRKQFVSTLKQAKIPPTVGRRKGTSKPTFAMSKHL